jgi:hypothetical protein
MEIPTEPIGSIPRPLALIEALRAQASDCAEGLPNTAPDGFSIRFRDRVPGVRS